MDNAEGLPGPVNLGNPGEFTVLELAEKVLKLTGSRSRIIHKPLPLDDPQRRRPDIELARKLLGWSPRITLDEGLRRTITHFSGGRRDTRGKETLMPVVGIGQHLDEGWARHGKDLQVCPETVGDVQSP